MNVYEALLGIVQVPSYIPGGAWSFSKFIGLLLWIVGFPIAIVADLAGTAMDG